MVGAGSVGQGARMPERVAGRATRAQAVRPGATLVATGEPVAEPAARAAQGRAPREAQSLGGERLRVGRAVAARQEAQVGRAVAARQEAQVGRAVAARQARDAVEIGPASSEVEAREEALALIPARAVGKRPFGSWAESIRRIPPGHGLPGLAPGFLRGSRGPRSGFD